VCSAWVGALGQGPLQRVASTSINLVNQPKLSPLGGGIMPPYIYTYTRVSFIIMYRVSLIG